MWAFHHYHHKHYSCLNGYILTYDPWLPKRGSGGSEFRGQSSLLLQHRPLGVGLSCSACPGAVTHGDQAVLESQGPSKPLQGATPSPSKFQNPWLGTKLDKYVWASPRGRLGMLKRIISIPTLSLLSFTMGKKSCSALQGNEGGSKSLYLQRELTLIPVTIYIQSWEYSTIYVDSWHFVLNTYFESEFICL